MVVIVLDAGLWIFSHYNVQKRVNDIAFMYIFANEAVLCIPKFITYKLEIKMRYELDKLLDYQNSSSS